MPVTVKICGLTSAADAAAALEVGADFLGFVFFPASRRCLHRADWAWVRRVEGRPKVGVFRDQDRGYIEAAREEAGLDLVQLHGSEPPELCAALGGPERVIKAVSVADTVVWEEVARYAEVARILFDTATPTGGGSGRRFDWRLLADRPPGLAFWLAGGLHADNVGEAIRSLQPAGVDVASGVEVATGRKDAARMRAFIQAVRAAAGRPDAPADGGRGDE